MNRNKIILCIFIATILMPLIVSGQSNLIIHTESWQNEYLKRLQDRGFLKELNPLVQPYTQKEVVDALSIIQISELNRTERIWKELLLNSFTEKKPNVDSELTVGGEFNGGAKRSTSSRLSLFEPQGTAKPLLPRGQLYGYMEWENLIARGGVTFDWFYDLDPDGIDVGDILYIRSEDVYVGYNHEIVQLYMGRYTNHWGLYGKGSGFLSNNARSFDHINFKFGNSTLSLRSILGELDGLNGNGTFTGKGYDERAIKRYAFLHRLDWRPTDWLMLSYIEAELYMSRSASLQIRNIMPMHFIFFESGVEPMNNDSNQMIGGSVYVNTNNLTYHLQLMLDDLVVNDRADLIENAELIPATYTIMTSLYHSKLIKNIGLGWEAELVSTNSYSSRSPENLWVYAKRGLATFNSDYIKTRFYTDFYITNNFDLHIQPYAALFLRGEKEILENRISRDSNGNQINTILAGTVERTIRPGVYLRFQPLKNYFTQKTASFTWWIDADMGYNFVDNKDNLNGQLDTSFEAILQLYGRIIF